MLMLSLRLPFVQRWTGDAVASALQQKLGTEVHIGRVDLGFFNRIIIDDIQIKDRANIKMADISRLSAKINILPLLQDGKIHISSAQLFGLKAQLYRRNATDKPNFQFLIDAFKSKEESQTPLDLCIQSLIIRHSAVSYDQLDAPQTPEQFNLQHLGLSNISSHMMLHTLTDDSLSLEMKKLAFKEKSGFNLTTLTFTLNAGKKNACIENLNIILPQTKLNIDKFTAQYKLKNGKLDKRSVHFNVNIPHSDITPCEFGCFIPELKDFTNSVSLTANANGSLSAINVSNIIVNSSTGSISIKGNGNVSNLHGSPLWTIHFDDLKASADGLAFIAKNLQGKRITIPDEIVRMGNIHFKGDIGGQGGSVNGRGVLNTDAGNASLDVALKGKAFKGVVRSDGFNLARILNDNTFGRVEANISAEGTIPTKVMAKGYIPLFDYSGHTYHNIDVDGVYDNGNISGNIALDDPNGQLDLEGTVLLAEKTPKINLTASVHHLNPAALNLTDGLGNRVFDFEAQVDIAGKSLEYSKGYVNIDNFLMNDGSRLFSLNNLHIDTGYQDEEHYVDLTSDFGNVLIRGEYDYKSLPQSFINLIGSRLPSLPGLPKTTNKSTNNFAIIANIQDASFAQQLLNISVTLYQPLHLKGFMNDKEHLFEADVEIPDFSYDNNRFTEGRVHMITRGEALVSSAYINKVFDDNRLMTLDIEATAIDNKLKTNIYWDAHQAKPLQGVLNAETEFFKNEDGHDAAHTRIHPSEVFIDNTKWDLHPSDIVYSDKQINIDHFRLSNNKQHIIVSGLATNNPEDSIVVDLQNVDVGYVLDLVNFTSVSFDGYASGHAVLKDVFGTPKAYTDLTVRDFLFENGRMGVLHALANYNDHDGMINIDAEINDAKPYGKTIVTGYIAPKKETLDLGIVAKDTRTEFAKNFCGSFLDNIEVRTTGACRVYGDFAYVNLEGKVITDGELDCTSTNTHYTLHNDTVIMIPNEILFINDSIFDRNNHAGVVNGALHHKYLSSMTFDFNIEAENLLAYDFHDYGNQTFFGTVYATGSCEVIGRKNSVTLNINAIPERGSFIEYNAAGPEGISNSEFIDWVSHNSNEYVDTSESRNNGQGPLRNMSSDIRINIDADVNNNFTLRVLMDEQTGDKISLTGEGGLHATYFNKGSFEMFGNYLIDYGTYTMTIQQVIKKNFVFQPGSTIVFSGDPFSAALNLKGQHTIPSVSLSDLQMGDSFSHNNIRVNCLMDIGGTAGAPSVTFGLDMPTLSADAQQMIRSVINSEEDMNQQVIYLLALGRFMPQGNNNATEEGTQQNQTSLAMQSLLSGTISQQLNAVLSNVTKNSNWNFGANISTGAEGWSNAEYEGLLRGRLLNNRLLINGEFGYRDNVNTQNGSSFIGDFDVQYLLLPNGNVAIKVYNETNDRYFTKNSLTTQGIGIILKKDFNSLNDLFGKKNKKSKHKKAKKTNK